MKFRLSKTQISEIFQLTIDSALSRPNCPHASQSGKRTPTAAELSKRVAVREKIAHRGQTVHSPGSNLRCRGRTVHTRRSPGKDRPPRPNCLLAGVDSALSRPIRKSPSLSGKRSHTAAKLPTRRGRFCVVAADKEIAVAVREKIAQRSQTVHSPGRFCVVAADTAKSPSLSGKRSHTAAKLPTRRGRFCVVAADKEIAVAVREKIAQRSQTLLSYRCVKGCRFRVFVRGTSISI
ncbi:hypothetical protein pipiens_013076 [Culex pipiens pipiens]|uniref:Uncharacterized protein n=1 Tax=Culex pipiens pipiens TaxID=38569 RepID=A0ABD1CZV3_CULPP